MKILITASTTPILHGIKSQDLARLMDSDAQIYFLTSPLDPADRCKLQNKGVRILELSDLVRKHALASPPLFSDIVSRKECPAYTEVLETYYCGKTVLVTGGEGYIGSSLVDALLKLPVQQVVAYGHGENDLYRLLLKYQDNPRFSYILGDVRDEEKLRRAFREVRPHAVFHAAAHKHVPILEAFPEEAVKTNILGTRKLASIAGEYGVGRFVLISTDKAVNPASALGSSKRIAEKICLSLDSLPGSTEYASVRFGNVFGSTGSAVPTFLQQLAEGLPLTLTDKNMMRYFMSVDEAARLVLLAGGSHTGNLFALDMGMPIPMMDIVEKIFAHCGIEKESRAIKIIGNRGGEKFSEELIHPFETRLSASFEQLIVLKDDSPVWTEREIALMCGEFSDAASFGNAKDVFALFEKYTSRYAGTRV